MHIVADHPIFLSHGRASERDLPQKTHTPLGANTSPTDRPLHRLTQAAITLQFEHALAAGDGVAGAHCIHELWMRGEMSLNVERALERLWSSAATSIPEWLPMRFIDWLPRLYEVALTFRASGKGR